MSELCNRLRERAGFFESEPPASPTAAMLREAAAEIERLTAKLAAARAAMGSGEREIASRIVDGLFDGHGHECCEIADRVRQIEHGRPGMPWRAAEREARIEWVGRVLLAVVAAIGPDSQSDSQSPNL